MQWAEYLNQEVTGFHREDYYLAQLAAVVERGHAKRPQSIRLQDYLLKFSTGAAQPTSHPSPAVSKKYWLGLLGLSEKG